MPKLTKQQITDLLKTPRFFESMQFNYGSYSAAGRELGISGRTFEEIGAAGSRGYKKTVSDRKLEQLQKAINRMSRGEYQAASRYVWTQDNRGMTPGQQKFAVKYSKTEKGRRYFRKTVNDYFNKKTKRVLMPALTSNGKIINSPRIKKVARGGSRRGIRRSRR
jgi:hypothetical protein